MKKREVALCWDEYEPGDLVRSADKRSGLEDGTTYEVFDFFSPTIDQDSLDASDLYGSAGLRNGKDRYCVSSAEYIRPANWWIEVRIDETRHWHWDVLDAILGKEGKVYGVYIYNELEYTYCCEMRPSYWLRHVYDFSSVMIPEEMMDKFDHASGMDSNDHYFYTTDIDALPDSDKCELGIFGCLGETSEEIEEQIREHVQGNPNWC